MREKYTKESLIKDLKNYIEKNGYPKTTKSFKKDNNLHCARIYHEMFGGDFVDWIQLCGYKLSIEEIAYLIHGHAGMITKDRLSRIILYIQSMLDHPITRNDIRKSDLLSTRGIDLVWGSMNNMRIDLGLPILQEYNMQERVLTKNQFDSLCKKISEDIHSLGRNFVTWDEIKSHKEYRSPSSLEKYSKLFYNEYFSVHMQQYDVFFGNQGNGTVYMFPDGEKTLSFYEYLFSIELRKMNLVYNVDYFKDVCYSSFIDGYIGNKSCDYKVIINGKPLYIEIPGMISIYKKWYYDNVPINDKIKEKYRLNLLEKENMLKENNIDYYFLFPCDLLSDEKQYLKIFSNSSTELRAKIENYYMSDFAMDKRKAQIVELVG